MLAGDHKQLPPTITCREAEIGGLGITLFDRLVVGSSSGGGSSGSSSGSSNGGESGERMLPQVCGVPVVMLNTQYRMNDVISTWSSNEMYHGKLLSDEFVRCRTLRGHPDVVAMVAARKGVAKVTTDDGSAAAAADDSSEDEDKDLIEELLDAPMVLVDTAGRARDDMGEMEDPDTGSKVNPGEALLVQRYIELLVQMGINLNDVAVVSPYSAQVSLLKNILSKYIVGVRVSKDNSSNGGGGGGGGVDGFDGVDGVSAVGRLEVRTVDGFQGREKEIVILSLVRSNVNKIIGFLSDHRRINVAVTRAKRQVVIICDTDTCGGGDVFLQRLIDHVETQESALMLVASELLPLEGGGGDAGGGGMEDSISVAASASSKYITSSANMLIKKSSHHNNSRKTEPRKRTNEEEKERERWLKDVHELMKYLHSIWSSTKNDGKKKEGKKKEIDMEIIMKYETKNQFGCAKTTMNMKKNGKVTGWSFSTNLNSYERREIHGIAEKLGMVHCSVGEEGNGTRQILLFSSVAEMEKDIDGSCYSMRKNGQKKVQVAVDTTVMQRMVNRTLGRALAETKDVKVKVKMKVVKEKEKEMVVKEKAVENKRAKQAVIPPLAPTPASNKAMVPPATSSGNAMLRDMHEARMARQRANRAKQDATSVTTGGEEKTSGGGGSGGGGSGSGGGSGGGRGGGGSGGGGSSSKKKKNKGKKKKKKSNDQQESNPGKGKKTKKKEEPVVGDGDDMDFLNSMIEKNEKEINEMNKKNKPKLWMREEVKRWKNAPIGTHTLGVRERREKAKDLATKITQSTSSRKKKTTASSKKNEKKVTNLFSKKK